jgi:hypothetical protein
MQVAHTLSFFAFCFESLFLLYLCQSAKTGFWHIVERVAGCMVTAGTKIIVLPLYT